MGLPFLAQWGSWVWKLSLVMIGGAAGWSWWALWRKGPRRRVRRAVDQIENARDGDIVRGRLGGGTLESLVALRPPPLQSSAADRRPDRVWIETADGKVALEGTVRVVTGSTTLWSRWDLPAGTPEAITETVPSGTRWSAVSEATYAAVVTGDEVVACGRLERVAGDAAADYRADAGVTVLRAPDDGMILLAAQTPSMPRSSSRAGIATVVALAVLGAGLVEHALGERWAGACSELADNADAPGVPALSNHDACVLASAMPRVRDDALDALAQRLDEHRAGGAAAFAVRLDLARRDGCDAALALLDREERYEQLRAEAHRCGDRRWEHIALVKLGRFAEAAALVVPASDADGERLAALPRPATLILAGRWADAAAIVSGWADADHDERYQCLAELLRVRAGDAGALARLRALAGSGDDACAVALAAAVPPDERDAILARGADPSALGLTVRWQTARDTISNPQDVLVRLDQLADETRMFPMWDAEAAPVDDTAPPMARIRAEEWHAVAAVLAGDVAAANTHVARARAAAASLPSDTDLSDLELLPELIGLYAPGPGPCEALAAATARDRSWWLKEFGDLALRCGSTFDEDIYLGSERYLAGLRRAQGGDATQLAAWMLSGDGSWQTLDLIAVLPRVKTGRAALVEALVWAKNEGIPDLDRSFPWAFAAHAAARRAVLDLAGAHAEAARWGAIYQRYDAALRDRKKLVPLLLLGRDW